MAEADAAFVRQCGVEDWDDERIKEASILIIGTGGVGCTFAMGLARLGVGRIVLIDRDVVDVSNLNRQILFSREQVGQRKVDAAAATLRASHCVRTEIVPVHVDAVKSWGRIVSEARECSVIFNGCDYGGFFDHAVSALAKHLGIPYVSASTYSWVFHNDFFDGAADSGCYMCQNPATLSLPDERLPDGADREAVVAALRDHVQCDHAEVAAMVDEALAAVVAARTGGAGDASRLAAAEAAPFRRALTRALEARLIPSRIGEWEDLSFIPCDKGLATQAVGSWVGVCVGGAMMAVTHWVNYVMGEGPPNWTGATLRAEKEGPFPTQMTWPFDKFHLEREADCPICADLAAKAGGDGEGAATATATATAAATAAGGGAP